MYAKNGIKLAEEQKFIKYERSACKILGDVEAKKKNYKSAFEYYVRYATLQDTLGNEIVKKKMAEVVFQNALNQKESENLLLQKDNEFKQQTIHNQQFLIVAAGVILLLGFILLVVTIRNNRKQHLLNKILDQKNKELKELNLTKDKFFSIIAHDLKGPFNGLLGLLTELDDNYDDLDELSKHRIIGSLKRSSHNTYNLLINLLDWTQSHGGKLTNVPQEFLLHEVTNEVLITLSARAVAKNQNLVNNIKQGTRVNADPQIVQAMLLNLVNNGIKFTPAGGTITVRIPEQENPLYLRVEVADNGVGIPESEVTNLFRIDTQYKQRGTENEPGTGLGLVMCKEYANLLGGEIGVRSEPGIGSVFHFTIGLPAVPQTVESLN
jgi:signal transduction histidine kinase